MHNPFEGELIRLRAREEEDEPLLFQWFNDPEVTQYLSMRYPLSHAQERVYIERNSEPGYGNANFAVVRKDTGELIGSVGLEKTSPENRSALLGITIGDKAHWDGGFGTDTMRTISRFAFTMMNLHRIELDVYVENARAIRCYEKVGYQHEGRLRDAVYKFGKYQDLLRMSVLEGEVT